MATHIGNDGTVKLSTNTVLQVSGFTLETNAAVADDTVLGDVWKTHITGGTKGWNGSVSCYWDESDTTGQEAMTEGASVALHLLPEGATTGDVDFNGTATITGVSFGVALDSTITASFTFQGNGALTRGTAA
jgi:hypothetical protein